MLMVSLASATPLPDIPIYFLYYTPGPAEAEFGELTAGFGTIQLYL
jgi:hypothetical protein